VSELEEYLKRLAKCGDFALAAKRADASDSKLGEWFNNPEILQKIAMARAQAQMRKHLAAPLMSRKDFIKALRLCTLRSTKLKKERDRAIIGLLVKNPGISDAAGARKMGISLGAYKMRKKRLIEAFFDQIFSPQQ
jgi:hypothetical protein